jgi:hypothetical protein
LVGANLGYTGAVACKEGQHFRAELSLILDREKEDGSLCIQIRLTRRGPGRHRDRYLYVCVQGAARRLDQPQPWRNAVQQPIVHTHRKHRRLSWVSLSRDIYWTPELSQEDLKAQVVIGLIQLGCVPSHSAELRRLLADYICRTYRMPRTSALPKAERTHARDAIAVLAAGNIVRNWVFPEDYRAFRLYIPKVIRHASRDYFDPRDECTNRRRHFGSEDDNDEECDPEVSWVPSKHDESRDEEGRPALSSFLSFMGSTPRVTLKNEMSVEEAATQVALSPSYVHRLIRQGRLQPIPGRVPIMLAKEEIERARKVLARRYEMRAKLKDLQKEGKTREASRKHIYRSLGGVPRI